MVDTHPEVIETIVKSNCNFCIFLDPDCYVFDKYLIENIFEELKNSLFTSPFFYFNKDIESVYQRHFYLD